MRTGSVTWVLWTERSAGTDQNKATYSHQSHQLQQQEAGAPSAEAVGLVALSGFPPVEAEHDFIVEETL